MSGSDTDLLQIKFQPGINTNTTKLDAEGTFVSGDKVRWFSGNPQKLGGWQKESYVGSVIGLPRGIYAWTDLNNNKYLSLGTTAKLQVLNGGQFYDITPVVACASTSNAFSVCTSSNVITLSVAPGGAQVGDYFIFTNVTACIGGINLTASGNGYVITSVGTGFIQFNTATSATTSILSKGGTTVVNFLLAVQGSSNSFAYGWGAGTWGTSAWGTPRDSGIVGVSAGLREWSMDNYGQDLIANPRGGAIFIWNPATCASARATIIASAAPSVVNITKVQHEGRHIVAFGTHDTSGNFDNMLVRWSDTDNYNTWVASASNEAGSYRLESGSSIDCVQETRQQFLIFTDESVYTMQKIGGQLVFSFQDMGMHTGIMSQHSSVDINGVTYWMGQKSFHYFNGVINTLPSTLQSAIYDSSSPYSVNMDQKDKIYAGLNKQFFEIWWFYPSRDSDEIDRYVIYNYMDNIWYYGALNRTTWLDSSVFEKPYATATDGTLYIHEQGVDADASAMKSFLHSSFFDLKDGDKMSFVDRIVPDGTITKGLNYTLKYKKYPQATEEFSKGPYFVAPDTSKISTRLRGRQLQVQYSTSAQGANYRIGRDRISIKPDGER